MRDVYIGGKRVRLSPHDSIGKGGEADVYDIGGGQALKIFKPPDHPDFTGHPVEQEGAKLRIKTQQTKLRDFPQGLSPRVIVPGDLATSRQQVVGYTMPLLSGANPLRDYSQRGFRQSVGNDAVTGIFRDLHGTVADVHRHRVVIGDFNDLNVLVKNGEAYVIDADSFQFGRYPATVYTARFVDPLLCDTRSVTPVLARPYTTEADWYAYAIMLMQSLLFVGPYGGVYRPKDRRQSVPHDSRPLKRITVFNPEVRYPKPAVPYQVLPDELLGYFQQVFEEDKREAFPIVLLDSLRWTTCSNCGTVHARAVCPHCTNAVVKHVAKSVRGRVTMTSMFQTSGTILVATPQGGQLKYLYHEDGAYRREDGSVVMQGGLDPQLRFRIRGRETLAAKGKTLVALHPEREREVLSIDTFGTNLPLFDATSRHRYWVAGGRLLRDGTYAPEHLGDVVSGQSLFWVSERFGFGFYRAGTLSASFVFDAFKRSLNDQVKLTLPSGQLIDSTAVFSGDRCWFFITSQEGSRTTNRCFVIRSGGTVEARAEAPEGDGSWLGTIRGQAAVGDVLLAATDVGLVQVGIDGQELVETKRFPDTEPFVDAGSRLVPGKTGLYVVGQQEIKLLELH